MHGSSEESVQNFCQNNLKGKDHLEDLGIDGRIILWLLEKYGGKVWTGFI
jgi:hypothetical protein